MPYQIENILERIRQRVPGLTEMDLIEIKNHLDLHEVPTRHFISREGSEVTDMYFLQSGLVKAFYFDETGDEIVINFVEENSFFTDFMPTINHCRVKPGFKPSNQWCMLRYQWRLSNGSVREVIL